MSYCVIDIIEAIVLAFGSALACGGGSGGSGGCALLSVLCLSNPFTWKEQINCWFALPYIYSDFQIPFPLTFKCLTVLSSIKILDY